MLFFLQFSFSKELKNHALFWLVVSVSEAYDALDPNGNITIKWDIISWTPDGYVVSISLLIESLSFEHILCHLVHVQLRDLSYFIAYSSNLAYFVAWTMFVAS